MGEGRRKRKMDVRNINQLPFTYAPPGDWTRNPGMYPDWESNQRPFTYGMMPHQEADVASEVGRS